MPKRRVKKRKYTWYVTMTDKFMSGWGGAKGKINKYVVICETGEQARRIEKNAGYRSEMKYINVTTTKPYYDPRRYLVTWKTYKQLGKIWKRP